MLQNKKTGGENTKTQSEVKKKKRKGKKQDKLNNG